MLHEYGNNAHTYIEYCRHMLANMLRVSPTEIFFTSGSTESVNIFIQGVLQYALQHKTDTKYTIITSSFEHPCVFNIFDNYKDNKRFNIQFIQPILDINDEYYGCISPSSVENAIKASPYPVLLVSIMHANNETGAIQNIKEIGTICKKYNIIFHSDTTQTLGKHLIYPKQYNIHSICLSIHKAHGPKGIGFIYISEDIPLVNLYFGGHQELRHQISIRPGTESVALIAGLTTAFVTTHKNRTHKNQQILNLKRYLLHKLQPFQIQIVGPNREENILENTLFILFKNLNMCNKVFVHTLSNYHICVSIGSACHKGELSHVLKAMQVDPVDAGKIIRISLSEYNTIDECDYFITCLQKIFS
jgi:cysteine desulfurase